MKSPELIQLHSLALEAHRLKHPNFPEEYRYVKAYSDRKANDLTRCIIDFLRFNGHQAERISVTGRYIDNTKIVENCLGNKRKIGSGKWIPGSMQPGSSDISATIRGRSVKIEVKVGRDVQSENQKRYQRDTEAAGGMYFIAHSFTEFWQWYKLTFES